MQMQLHDIQNPLRLNHGMGMLLPSFETLQTTLLLILSPTQPLSALSMAGWRPGLEAWKVKIMTQEQFMGNRNEIRKLKEATAILMTEGTRKMQRIHTETIIPDLSLCHPMFLEREPFPHCQIVMWAGIE